ncbi:MAG: rhomboid family intramembrane serine protease [Fibrobacter sp.]|uniref:rhomboid family intramembrane serine protease n=1 Tax=Fibrobacter sp. TaxID=35828 RepID=UPI001B0F2F34|nr:rhomboid family intramembrane serine protease [Fibrobacter sp.]MBO7060642.1 rhomboid family intramembrane serine protease [Fibrobacter sp.]
MKPFRYLAKPIRVLLIANLVVFLLAFLVGGIMGLHLNIPGAGYGSLRDYITFFGAFFPTSPFEVWRYFTYMFVHVDFWHFLFNMLMLWMFGDEVAEWMGSKHFTGMYVFCGVVAAVFCVAMCLLGLTNNPIIGASGALMGIFVAYYRFFPERRLLLFFFFPMKIKYAMWVMVAIDVFMAPSGDGIAHLAHLGGVVAGFIYMYFYEGGFRRLSGALKSRGPKVKVTRGGKASSESDEGNNDSSDAIEGEVFYVDEEKRMDEILKKVSSEGVQSLSVSERKFLMEAGERLRRRRGG